MTSALQLLLCVVLLVPAWARAEAPETPEEIKACVVRNTPDASHVQAIELVSRDRVGTERRTRAHIYGRIDAQGYRRILARFTEPEELQGAAFLFIERKDANELVVRSEELEKVKRVTGREMLGSIAGTDLTYEDFERLTALNRPSSPKRLPDAEIDGRPAFALESRPAEPEASAYERVTHYVDRATCLVLRVELYEKGGRLRKVVEAQPDRFREFGSVWVAQEVVLRDLRDETQTTLLVESFDMDADIPTATFTVEALEKGDVPAPPEAD